MKLEQFFKPSTSKRRQSWTIPISDELFHDLSNVSKVYGFKTRQWAAALIEENLPQLLSFLREQGDEKGD